MIIVTGGAGFIGSALVWHLNNLGYKDILVVDNLGTKEKWKNLAKASLTDIITIEDFEALEMRNLPPIEAVFHMGAISTTTEPDADKLFRLNVHASMRLFYFCENSKIPFIYASSAATYGAESEAFYDDEEFLTNLKPINKYGYSKHFFDKWVLNQASRPPVWAGLKFFNVYGPNEYHKGSQASVAFHAYPQIQETKTLKLFKSYLPNIPHGQQMRDFVYVKDVVRVCAHFLNKDQPSKSGIYNVGTGQARSFLDLMHACGSCFDGKATEAVFIEMPENIKSQYQYYTQANIIKLRHKAGYEAEFTSLESGIKEYFQNYLMNQDPYL